MVFLEKVLGCLIGMTSNRKNWRNISDIFGEVSTYKCRVCKSDLDDGRKSYCSRFCRDLAYEVVNKFRWNSLRKKVLKRDGYCCRSCGVSEDNVDAQLEIDHIVAVSEGGSMWDMRNLQSLCKSCHVSKGKLSGDFDNRTVGEGLFLFSERTVVLDSVCIDSLRTVVNPDGDIEYRVYFDSELGSSWFQVSRSRFRHLAKLNGEAERV